MKEYIEEFIQSTKEDVKLNEILKTIGIAAPPERPEVRPEDKLTGTKHQCHMIIRYSCWFSYMHSQAM